MSLMERVSALIRANLNDLIEKAEDPAKMLKQVILDMENQLIQVKTQMAMAIADEHLLSKRKQENDEKFAEWMRKAQKSVDKNDDELARAALERAEICRLTAAALDEQLADHKAQTDALRTALRKLERKLVETRSRCDFLIAELRRSRAVRKAADAGIVMRSGTNRATFNRMRRKVQHADAMNAATVELAEETIDERFNALDREERIEQLLADLKTGKKAS